MTTKRLRPEARPIGWQSLDWGQREAFRQILYLMEEAVDQLPIVHRDDRSSSYKSFPVSRDRSSRTAFLSGARGAGKTSVLLSLARYTQPNVTLPAIRHDSKDSENCDEKKDKVSERAFHAMQKLQGRVVWLEPIDMEPAPPNLNVLAAIMARIENACTPTDLSKSGEDEWLPGVLDERSGLWGALDNFKRIQSNIILAWSHYLKERAPQLDPESYAIEASRIEKSRLTLNHGLARALDGLAKTQHGSQIDPLFVLPIDDFDLNPVASLEVLRLLRMISVPRLFVLVLGDIETMGTVLNLRLGNEFAKIMENVQKADMISVDPLVMSGVIGSVAAESIRKLVPPGQRVSLAQMTWKEGIEYEPIGAESGKSIQSMLVDCTMMIGSHIIDAQDLKISARRFNGQALENLFDFFQFRGFSPITMANALNSDRYCYSGLGMFATTPRRLADLWFAFRRYHDHLVRERCNAKNYTVSKEENAQHRHVELIWNRLIHLFSAYCLEGLLEEPMMVADRDAIRRALTMTAATDWNWNELPLRITSVTEAGGSIVSMKNIKEVDYRREYRFFFGRRWQFECDSPWSTLQSPTKIRRLIPNDKTSALIVLHDLITIGPRGHAFTSPKSFQENESWNLAETTWGFGPVRSVSLKWPLPKCMTISGLDSFRQAWNLTLQHARRNLMDKGAIFESLVFSWIAVGCALVSGDEQVFVSTQHPRPGDWDNCVRTLGKLAKSANLRREREEWHAKKAERKWQRRSEQLSFSQLRRWLVDVSLLTMPEYGLLNFSRELDNAIAKIVGEKQLLKFWIANRRIIRRERALRLAKILNAGLEDVMEDCRYTLPPNATPQSIGKMVGRDSRGLTPTAEFVERIAKNEDAAEYVAGSPGVGGPWQSAWTAKSSEGESEEGAPSTTSQSRSKSAKKRSMKKKPKKKKAKKTARKKSS